MVADFLANMGHSLDLGLHVWDAPLVGYDHLLIWDFCGVALPRSITC